jgi:hypothetical protein
MIAGIIVANASADLEKPLETTPPFVDGEAHTMISPEDLFLDAYHDRLKSSSNKSDCIPIAHEGLDFLERSSIPHSSVFRFICEIDKFGLLFEPDIRNRLVMIARRKLDSGEVPGYCEYLSALKNMDPDFTDAALTHYCRKFFTLPGIEGSSQLHTMIDLDSTDAIPLDRKVDLVCSPFKNPSDPEWMAAFRYILYKMGITGCSNGRCSLEGLGGSESLAADKNERKLLETVSELAWRPYYPNKILFYDFVLKNPKPHFSKASLPNTKYFMDEFLAHECEMSKSEKNLLETLKNPEKQYTTSIMIHFSKWQCKIGYDDLNKISHPKHSKEFLDIILKKPQSGWQYKNIKKYMKAEDTPADAKAYILEKLKSKIFLEAGSLSYGEDFDRIMSALEVIFKYDALDVKEHYLRILYTNPAFAINHSTEFATYHLLHKFFLKYGAPDVRELCSERLMKLSDKAEDTHGLFYSLLVILQHTPNLEHREIVLAKITPIILDSDYAFYYKRLFAHLPDGLIEKIIDKHIVHSGVFEQNLCYFNEQKIIDRLKTHAHIDRIYEKLKTYKGQRKVIYPGGDAFGFIEKIKPASA